jgi:hypothetical protein
MSTYLLNRGQANDATKFGQALLDIIGENLDLKRWNFRLGFTDFVTTSNLVVIYDTGYCRLSFMLSLQQTPRYDELVISYGRSHARNDEPYMDWHGEKCRCWHYVFDPLRFLDGLSPSEAVHQAKVEKRMPNIVESYRKSELGLRLFNEYPPKAAIVMHSVIWDHYGQKLFDLFDLSKPKLWEEYKVFIREYYKLLGTKASFGPPYENIC